MSRGKFLTFTYLLSESLDENIKLFHVFNDINEAIRTFSPLDAGKIIL